MGTILVVDDDPQLRQSFEKILSQEGHTTWTAPSGEAALALIRENLPDLLILDLEIPYLEELARQAHFQDQDPPVPLIIHSFGEDYPSGAQMARAAAFLEKTEDPARLKEVVAEVLGKYYPRRFLGSPA